MSIATDYEAYIRASRRAQLDNDAQAVADLEALLAQTASNMRKAITETPRGILGERFRRQALASIEAELDLFRDRYKALLDPAILAAGAIVEEREKALLQSLLTHSDELPLEQRTAVLFDAMHSAETQLGGIPQQVLQHAYTRTYADGLKLSERLYGLDRDARKAAADIVADGLARGMSAADMGYRLEALLTTDTQTQEKIAARAQRVIDRREARKANQERVAAGKPEKALPPAGVDDIGYRARRIARTEINTAFREGHILSVSDPETGQLKPWATAVGWRLSPAHPRVDICDAWAGDDEEGLGEGNYSPGNVPPGHPHCLCYTVTILAILPDEQFVSFKPLPADVPESQRKYYGRSREADAASEE